MKKLLALFLVVLFVGSLLAACNNGGNESAPESEQEISTEESIMTGPDENAKKVWQDIYADKENGIGDAEKVFNLDLYREGVEIDVNDLDIEFDNDVRMVFNAEEATRAVVLSEGYAVTLPGGDVKADYSLGSIRSQYTSESKNYRLTLSYEAQNPYGASKKGLIDTYYDGWLFKYYRSDDFLKANGLARTRDGGVTTDLLPGYEVEYYGVHIKVDTKIEYPYYAVAAIHKIDDYTHFWLFVLKSKEKGADALLDSIVKSFVELEEKNGNPESSVGSYELRIPDYWNEETRAYYDLLTKGDTVYLGAFYAGHSYEYQDWLEGEIGNNLDIFMTYFHLGWGTRRDDIDMDRITRQAGGNGFNGKEVLELTYQFTTTNNTLGGDTPMFDILRGRCDLQFKKLAQDIKAYGKPVLFRLNNEMNTDWTSYCGMQTLLDPDIFVATWRRLYDIFREEGVDNCIWIWNPNDVTCPYCNWGDMLAYFPGEDYVQLLGLTAYVKNNGGSIKSFRQAYTELYNKNTPYFDNYPAFIGEFAVGGGGEYEYDWGIRGYKAITNIEVLRRQQANWITQMFDDFMHKNEEGYEFCKNIVGGAWFSANDYKTDPDTNGGEQFVQNRFQLDENTPLAIKAFADGYQKLLDARKK